MKVKCPHCGYIAMSPDQSAGNEMECPQCKNLHVAKACEVDEVMADGGEAMKKESPPESWGLMLLMLFGVLLIVLSVLSVLFAASEVVVVVVAFGGIAVGVVLIALGYLQRHIEKTAYWANRIHEELRRQNKVK